MSRPEPTILLEIDIDDCVLQITKSYELYQVTYKKQPIGIRKLVAGLGYEKKKYPRTTYDNEGSARACARRLNEYFTTTDFGYHKVN